MTKNKKWWLVSDETIQKVREALPLPGHEANDFNCPHPGDPEDKEECSRCENIEKRHKALHDLEAGLHITDCIPDDYKEG